LDNNQLCGVAQNGRGTFTLDAISAICDALTKSNIQSISISGNWFGVEGGMKLAEALPKMPNLREVNLDNNYLCGVDEYGGGKFTPDAINAICDALTKSNVQSISVKKNGITGEAAQKLAKVVLEMPWMTDFGGIPIKALRDNTATELDLSNKDLGVPEGMVLSGLVPGASSLATLNLDNNQLCGVAQNGRGTFTLVAISAICDALTKSNIQSISLDNNQLCGVDEYGGGKFTLDAINAICDALTKSNIQSISIKDNRLNQKAKQALESVAAGRDVKIDF